MKVDGSSFPPSVAELRELVALYEEISFTPDAVWGVSLVRLMVFSPYVNICSVVLKQHSVNCLQAIVSGARPWGIVGLPACRLLPRLAVFLGEFPTATSMKMS